jgi:hypothetical protein
MTRSGHPGKHEHTAYFESLDRIDSARGALIRARCREEEFGQANFDANVLLEPAARLEIVKHVTGYRKILSERDLKLEMAPQEVISTDRHISLRQRDR